MKYQITFDFFNFIKETAKTREKKDNTCSLGDTGEQLAINLKIPKIIIDMKIFMETAIKQAKITKCFKPCVMHDMWAAYRIFKKEWEEGKHYCMPNFCGWAK